MMFRIRFGNPDDWRKRLSFMDSVLGGYKAFFAVRPDSIQIRGFDLDHATYAMLTYKPVPGFDVFHVEDEVTFGFRTKDIVGTLKAIKKVDFLELSMEDSEHLIVEVGGIIEGEEVIEGKYMVWGTWNKRGKHVIDVWKPQWDELEKERTLQGVDSHLTVTMEVYYHDFIEALDALDEITKLYSESGFEPRITFDALRDWLFLVPPVKDNIVSVRARIKPLKLERRGQLAKATYDTDLLDHIRKTSRYAIKPTKLTIRFGHNAPLKTEMEFQNGNLVLYIAAHT